MSSYWWAVLLVILALIAAFVYYIQTESGKKEWDVMKMKIPIVRKLFEAMYVTRFSDNLMLMVNSGIPIVRALSIVSEVVDNSVYRKVILRAAEEVRSGGQIHTVLMRSSLFPTIVGQMVRIGEETGKLGEVLRSVTRFYNNEVDRIARNMTALIEPVLIIILAVGVAFMVFAILLPIYNLAGKMA